MAVRDDIAQYISHFRAKNREIEKISDNVFRGILYLVGIDTLSHVAFPQELSNRKRVVYFIDIYSNWDGKDRVSAVQLKFILEDKGIRSGRLYDTIYRRINSWVPRQIIWPANDSTLEEVEPLATSNEVKKYVKDARYKELLYTYRNCLLHESREPEEVKVIVPDSREPYYGWVHKPNQCSWVLVFPVQFLQRLCECCVTGLEKHLYDNNLNPYDTYESVPMWRRSR
jgi:hypothetical protein